MSDMVSYRFRGGPETRFIQYAKDPLPEWADDVQPYVAPPPPSLIAPHVWASAVKRDYAGKPLWVYLADHPDFTEVARALLEAYLTEMPEGSKE